MSSEERASWGQLRPMLHLTRGCPTLIPHPLSALSFPFFPFSHFSFPTAGSCLRVLLHLPGDAPPCRPPPTHPYSTPSLPLTRSKEVSGVTVSTACRLSAPLPLLTQKNRLGCDGHTYSLLFIWERGHHPNTCFCHCI